MQLSSQPYVEMLVPRRKGQLLKLVILLPLSLLLVTSIYYQFYYEQAVGSTPLPSAAAAEPLVYRRHRAEPPTADQLDEPSSRESRRLLSYRQRMKLDRQRGQVYNNQQDDEESYNQSDQHDHYNHNHQREHQQQQDKPHSGKVKTKSASHRLINELDDNSHESNSEESDELELPSRTTSDETADRPRALKSNKYEQARRGANKLQQPDQIRVEEEEANAQDAAVIPAPSEPSGPGELGRPVILKNLTKEQQDLVSVGWENNAFNQYVSDIISINRTLPDVRDPSCKQVTYPNLIELPQTSVIICFHNEAWSVLLRTVHSILNRSPRQLVKEIILVDDFSNKPHLGKQLEDYIKPLEIVKVVRAKRREGLIRARLIGAQEAKAPVLTFLDSHCECAEGWLEPLLARIHEDSRAVVCPVIDVISDKTFEYHYKSEANSVSVGGFDWNLQFNWHAMPERERKRRHHPYEPIRSPTMAGGLFSIDKAFFERLGTYDSGFDIWGGENLELSFKTWMCGGTLEILPCSHVGHVFRSRSPYAWRTGVNVLKRNSVRLAEVWMDDYKRYYYDRIGNDLGDFGDVSERLALRERLQCKPFSYYVHEIYPELFVPGDAVAYGELRNLAGPKVKMCIDSSARKSEYHKPLGVYPCHGAGGNQYWLFSREGEIRRDEACVDYFGQDVVLLPCHGSGGNQLWYYQQNNRLIKHSTSNRCMELSKDRLKLIMSDCDPANENQHWQFQHFNATLATANSGHHHQ